MKNKNKRVFLWKYIGGMLVRVDMRAFNAAIKFKKWARRQLNGAELSLSIIANIDKTCWVEASFIYKSESDDPWDCLVDILVNFDELGNAWIDGNNDLPAGFEWRDQRLDDSWVRTNRIKHRFLQMFEYIKQNYELN